MNSYKEVYVYMLVDWHINASNQAYIILKLNANIWIFSVPPDKLTDHMLAGYSNNLWWIKQADWKAKYIFVIMLSNPNHIYSILIFI